ncbi:MAG: helix-turn-helix transcriptional regulator, partial [Croceibacterium sp.]
LKSRFKALEESVPAARPDTAPAETFGARVKHLRQQRGLSLQALSRQIGVSKPALWKWERDEVRPRPATLDRLAEVLDVAPSELVFGTGPIAPLGATGGAVDLGRIVASAKREIALTLGLDPAAIELSVSLRV